MRVRWLKAALAVLGALLIGGLLSEGVLRLLFPHWVPRTAVLTQFWRRDASLGWSHVPNAKGRFNAFGVQTSISIPTVSAGAPAGTKASPSAS